MSRAATNRNTIRKSPSSATSATAAVLAALAAAALLSASPAAAGPSAQNLEVLALGEDFEGVLGGRGWQIDDHDAANGADFWAASDYRASSGNYSAWAPGAGSRFTVINIWASDFENGTAGWTFADRNNTDSAGLDYWGLSSVRAHNGTNSIWCAQVGTNYYNGGGTTSNVQLRLYDSYMNSTATVSTDLTGYSDINLEYWYWQNSENGWDNLYVAWFDGAWHFENQQFPNAAPSLGWRKATYPIPSTATQVGFMFTSDSSINYEGVYLDDIRLYVTRTDQNRDLRLYDDFMDTQMTHDVDVSYFDSARLEYRYWLEATGNDSLQVMLYDGNAWSFVDSHTGLSGGWAASNVQIPVSTQKVGFRFVSDNSGRAEGAYIDDLHVYGSVLPVECTAITYETAGMEVVSTFHLAGTGSGGLRPYAWSWAFGDGTTVSGTKASDQSPTHTFPEVGVYTPVLTVTDSLGQTCSTPTASITTSHDLTDVFITPASAELKEGTSVTVYGFDGQGHPFSLDWALFFPECGELSTTHGTQVAVTAATDAGGTTCTVTGSVTGASSSMRLEVTQDTSIINLLPATATVIEGHGIRLAATDRYGGDLPFIWTTTCGRVGGAVASFTLFEAVTEGGVACTITATYGGDYASAVVAVVHDTALIDVTPKSAQLLEGGAQSFGAVDGYGHPFEAEWSVDPEECGSFSIAAGASTTFTSHIDAGGLECTVIVAYGADHHEVGVSVGHDLRDASVTPTSASLAGGAAVSFNYGDANGHAFSALWSVSPGGCGAFNPSEGPSTTLTVSGDFAGYTCTVSGTGIGFTRFASVVVQYGAPAAIFVTPSSDVVEADGSVLVTATVKDAAGHTIPSTAVDWSASTCGAVSGARGVTTILSAPASAAGSRCTVTGSLGGISGSAEVRVNHVGPFTVRVTPESPTLSGGQSQVFTAVVTDGAGAPVPDAGVVWSSTCGLLSNTTGPSVTFVAPADIASRNCEITASASAGGVAYQSRASVRAASSPLLLILGIAVAALLGGVVAMRMRSRGRGQAPELASPEAPSTAADPGVPPPPPEAAAAGPALACPRCASPIETGWTACPECGTDLAAAPSP